MQIKLEESNSRIFAIGDFVKNINEVMMDYKEITLAVAKGIAQSESV